MGLLSCITLHEARRRPTHGLLRATSLAPTPFAACAAAGCIDAGPIGALLGRGRVRRLEGLPEARRRAVRGRIRAAAARAQERVAVPDALELPAA